MNPISEYFPVWDKLTNEQKKKLSESAVERQFPRGAVIHEGGMGCTGLLVIQSGQLRAFITSADGREITLYRLLERDICLFSASCMIRSIQFDISIEAETDCRLWIIPADAYHRLMEQAVPLSGYTNELMAARFSEVMWLMEQILWGSMDQRIATYLLEQSDLQNSDRLTVTHEQIARDLGTAREVVTRMLRYFKNEGMVRISRGSVEITDKNKLSAIAENKKPAE